MVYGRFVELRTDDELSQDIDAAAIAGGFDPETGERYRYSLDEIIERNRFVENEDYENRSHGKGPMGFEGALPVKCPIPLRFIKAAKKGRRGRKWMIQLINGAVVMECTEGWRVGDTSEPPDEFCVEKAPNLKAVWHDYKNHLLDNEVCVPCLGYTLHRHSSDGNWHPCPDCNNNPPLDKNGHVIVPLKRRSTAVYADRYWRYQGHDMRIMDWIYEGTGGKRHKKWVTLISLEPDQIKEFRSSDYLGRGRAWDDDLTGDGLSVADSVLFCAKPWPVRWTIITARSVKKALVDFTHLFRPWFSRYGQLVAASTHKAVVSSATKSP